MSEMETVGILEEIGALVTDRLQVVSYKWLSRHYLVSSNTAKKLLEEFVEKHDGGLEVVYSLAGWLKRAPPTYHITLVQRPRLAEAKKDFDDNCSIQVYSVQACIPKDPAELWNAEFLQAEELFRQPVTVNNCLRDNRFCGVSNSLVERRAEEVPIGISAAPHKSGSISGLSKANSTLQSEPKKVQPSGSKAGLASSSVNTDGTARANNLASKPDINKQKVEDKKKAQPGASSVGNGGSLANLWVRASTKSKGNTVPAEAANDTSKYNVSADAQIGAIEALEDASSDDNELPDVNFKRASNGESTKKRRFVLDDSDEEVEYAAVSLESPDPPKGLSSLSSEQKSKPGGLEGNILDFEQGNDEPSAKVEDETPKEANQLAGNELSTHEGNTNRNPSSPNIDHGTPDDAAQQSNLANVALASPPKRRKVLKTRIDERGREVTEVVWEVQETEIKNNSSNVTKNANDNARKRDNNTRADHVNSAPTTKKSAAVGGTAASHPAGKAGSKKGGKTKDPKQGNILSFFKKA